MNTTLTDYVIEQEIIDDKIRFTQDILDEYKLNVAALDSAKKEFDAMTQRFNTNNHVPYIITKFLTDNGINDTAEQLAEQRDQTEWTELHNNVIHRKSELLQIAYGSKADMGLRDYLLNVYNNRGDMVEAFRVWFQGYSDSKNLIKGKVA